MVTFVCDKCNFSIVRDKSPSKCPYCGKGSMFEKPSAQDILDGSVNEFDDIGDDF